MFFEEFKGQSLLQESHTGYSVPYLARLEKSFSNQHLKKYEVVIQHPNGALYEEGAKKDKKTDLFVPVTAYGWNVTGICLIIEEEQVVCESISESLSEKTKPVSGAVEASQKGASAYKSCHEKTLQNCGGVCHVAPMKKSQKRETETAKTGGNTSCDWLGNLNNIQTHQKALRDFLFSTISAGRYHIDTEVVSSSAYETTFFVTVVDTKTMAIAELGNLKVRDEGITDPYGRACYSSFVWNNLLGTFKDLVVPLFFHEEG
jgi:hypothetical protein